MAVFRNMRNDSMRPFGIGINHFEPVQKTVFILMCFQTYRKAIIFYVFSFLFCQYRTSVNLQIPFRIWTGDVIHKYTDSRIQDAKFFQKFVTLRKPTCLPSFSRRNFWQTGNKIPSDILTFRYGEIWIGIKL